MLVAQGGFFLAQKMLFMARGANESKMSRTPLRAVMLIPRQLQGSRLPDDYLHSISCISAPRCSTANHTLRFRIEPRFLKQWGTATCYLSTLVDTTGPSEVASGVIRLRDEDSSNMAACRCHRDSDCHACISAHPGSKSTNCRPSSQHDRLAGNPRQKRAASALWWSKILMTELGTRASNFLHVFSTVIAVVYSVVCLISGSQQEWLSWMALEHHKRHNSMEDRFQLCSLPLLRPARLSRQQGVGGFQKPAMPRPDPCTWWLLCRRTRSKLISGWALGIWWILSTSWSSNVTPWPPPPRLLIRAEIVIPRASQSQNSPVLRHMLIPSTPQSLNPIWQGPQGMYRLHSHTHYCCARVVGCVVSSAVPWLVGLPSRNIHIPPRQGSRLQNRSPSQVCSVIQVCLLASFIPCLSVVHSC